MANFTKFNTDNAEDLLRQLQQFKDIMDYDWSRVLNQWNNLKLVWQDQQFDEFEILFEKLIANYRDTEKDNEEYIEFIRGQIKIAEERNEKLSNFKI